MQGDPVDDAAGISSSGSGDSQGLMAARLRNTTAVRGPGVERLPRVNLEYWARGDAGHLHRAADLASVPISSHRRLGGPLVVPLKRLVRRLLFPLLDVQTSVNGANARVITFVLAQLAAQARSIEELERQVAELLAERER